MENEETKMKMKNAKFTNFGVLIAKYANEADQPRFQIEDITSMPGTNFERGKFYNAEEFE